MKKHRLLLYAVIGRRVRGKALLMVLFLALIAVYDLFVPVLGERWPLVWVALLASLALWFYYAVLLRRAALQVRPRYLRLQGPLYGLNISYERLLSVTTTLVGHQYPPDQISGYERELLKEFQGATAVLVELRALPPAFKRRRFWFHRLLFSTTRPGLLLMVDDWMAASRDIEAARTKWYDQYKPRERPDNRSLAARVLDS